MQHKHPALSEHDFMVVDAGGGTVDITVHRNRSGGGLIELYSPSGGAWGSSFINEKFETLLDELLGKRNVAKVKNSTEWFTMMDIFEVCIALVFYI